MPEPKQSSFKPPRLTLAPQQEGGGGSRYAQLARDYLASLFRPNYLAERALAESEEGMFGGFSPYRKYVMENRQTPPNTEGLQKFQLRLVSAGLLDPDKVRSFGGPDPATFKATSTLFALMETYGLSSVDEVLAYAEAQRTAGKQKTTRTIVVHRPKKMNEADLDAVLLEGSQKMFGRALRPEEENLVESRFRSAEAQAADVSVANQRRQQEIADADAEGRGPGGVVTLDAGVEPPDPRSVLKKELSGSIDAQAFKTALYIMRLFGMGNFTGDL